MRGFPEAWNETQKITYAVLILNSVEALERQHLTPLKIQCKDDHVAGRMLFDMMRAIKRLDKDHSATRKICAAPERQPEVGYKRPVLRQAAADIRAWQPDIDEPGIHWGAAEINTRGKVVLRAQGGRIGAAGHMGTVAPAQGRIWTPRPLTRTCKRNPPPTPHQRGDQAQGCHHL